MRNRYIYMTALLMMVLMLAACGGDNERNESDGNTDGDGNAPAAETDDDAETNDEENAGDENDAGEADDISFVNVQDFEFDKTEDDLEQLITFAKDNEDDDFPHATNANVNSVPDPYIAGEDEVLINHSRLIDSDGEGEDLYDDMITDARAISGPAGSSYRDGTFYLGFEDGVYAMDGADGDMQELADDIPSLLKTDSEKVYYVSSPEDEDDYTLHVLDRDDGEEIWKTDTIEFGVQGLGSLDVIPMEDYVVYQTIDSIQAFDKESGDVIWEMDEADRFLELVEAEDVLIGVTSRDNIPGAYELKEFDKETGESTYSEDLPETFSPRDQNGAELTVDEDMLFIDLEQSVLGYDLEEQQPVWAFGGDDGFHTTDDTERSDDTMHMDVALTPDGDVIVDGVMNYDPQMEAEEQRFITTIDPESGDIHDGYLINENIERNISSNTDYDHKFLITRDENNSDSTDEDFQAFVGTVE